MANSAGIVQIVESAQQLAEVVPSERLLEFASALEDCEELAILDVIHENVEHFEWFRSVEEV